jgi:hypothetical protein
MFQHLGILKTPLPWVVFLLVGAYIFTKTKLHRQNATKVLLLEIPKLLIPDILHHSFPSPRHNQPDTQKTCITT